jgi:outer membrane protein
MGFELRNGWLIAAALCVCLPGAGAQAAENLGSVGVIDVTVIFSQSEAAKSIEKQRNDLREGFLDEITRKEDDLRKQEQALKTDAQTLSQDEYSKRVRAYEENLNATRKLAQENKAELEDATGAAMDKLREALYVITREIAGEKGFSLVISNRDVITGEKSLDITEEALRRLNQRIKTVAVKIVKTPDEDDAPPSAKSGKKE